MRDALNLAAWVFLAYFAAYMAGHAVLFGLALAEIFRVRRLSRPVPVNALAAAGRLPPVSILCPAHNEEATIVGAVRALLSLRYPEHEVVVINDGSEDGTLERLREAFALFPADAAGDDALLTRTVRGVYRSLDHPNLLVVDKENGGKADALNAGANLARYPWVCSIDADSYVDRDALLKIAAVLVADPSCVAVGGNVRILNGSRIRDDGSVDADLPRSWLARMQAVEYIRAFTAARMGLAGAGVLCLISGAFGVFRRQAVIEAGGYRARTVGEDFELVVRLHRRLRERGERYTVRFLPEPICWTEVPERIAALARQRNRWHRGLLDTLWLHRRMLFRRPYGRVGWAGLPWLWLFEAAAPWAEAAGYVVFTMALATAALSWHAALLWMYAAVASGTLLSWLAVLWEQVTHPVYPARRLPALLVAGLLENFGYRQLTVAWRLAGTLAYMRGDGAWGSIPRQGLTTSPQPPRIRKSASAAGSPTRM